MLAALLARFAPYKALASVLAAGVLVLAFYVQHLHLRLAAEQSTSAGRLAVIKSFEASTAALRADAQQREKTAKAASAAAALTAARAQRRIESIKSAPVPQDCADAMKWLAEQGPALEQTEEAKP